MGKKIKISETMVGDFDFLKKVIIHDMAALNTTDAEPKWASEPYIIQGSKGILKIGVDHTDFTNNTITIYYETSH